MKSHFLLIVLLFLSGCASQFAARDCENLGYEKGTPEFTKCAERQLVTRREAILEERRQKTEIAIEKEKASHGIFGRSTGEERK